MTRRTAAYRPRLATAAGIALFVIFVPTLLPGQESPIPDSIDPALAEARRQLNAGRLDQSVSAYRQFLAANPGYWQVREELAQVLLTLRRLDEAERELQQAILTKREQASLWAHLGQVYLLKEDSDHAQISLERARQLDPNLPSVHFNLGRLYEKQGLEEEGLEEYLAFLDLAPDDSRALRVRLRLALYYDSHNEPGKAIEELRKLIEKRPKDPRYHQRLGDVYYRKADYESALENYLKVLELQPENADVRYNIAFIYKTKSMLQEAEEQLLMVTQMKPESPEVFYLLGTVQHELTKYEEAAATFERSIALDPEGYQTHYYYSRTLLKLGRREEARREIELHRKLEAKARAEDGGRTMGDIGDK